MIPETDFPIGSYLPGHSLLHRLDPRLKLVAVPLLVAATFAAISPGQLGGLSLVAGSAWMLAGLPPRMLARLAWALRWLLLFTLVVHLLFAPGHTLFGLSWLSMEGLQDGLFACWRLLLALLFAALLAATTLPAQLTAALAWLLRPLEYLRLPVAAAADLILLVLHFIPLMRVEALAVHAGLVAEAGGIPPTGYLARGRFVCRMLTPLLLRLVERADRLAAQLAAGEPVPGLELASPLAPCRAGSVALFGLITLLAALCYGRLA
ncbi:energy-coupling factor transporter transmembrane component T [Desulfuromonas carbonis]|uniref:energy-coupling factor transporter transmembrane component T family protein n=1 Tax=Desulfuromonas sp. DDH964 TaxID=1823759 RepID=UPI0008301B06|nr:energy-coupling factor transporter transmembrane protein EcfT [Desulfuromonas sp. DDH964]